jgi:hypothetical protein
MNVVIGLIAFLEKNIALFTVMHKTIESGPAWRRVLFALLGCIGIVAVLAGSWVLVSTWVHHAEEYPGQFSGKAGEAEMIPAKYAPDSPGHLPDKTCAPEMNLAKYAPDFPECGKQAYVASRGTCTYPAGTFGISKSSREVDARAFCERLAIRSLAKR